MIFDLNFPVLLIAGYLTYYFALDPVAAVRTVPKFVTESLLILCSRSSCISPPL